MNIKFDKIKCNLCNSKLQSFDHNTYACKNYKLPDSWYSNLEHAYLKNTIYGWVYCCFISNYNTFHYLSKNKLILNNTNEIYLDPVEIYYKNHKKDNPSYFDYFNNKNYIVMENIKPHSIYNVEQYKSYIGNLLFM